MSGYETDTASYGRPVDDEPAQGAVIHDYPTANAWIARDGTTYYVAWWGHCQTAERLGDSTGGRKLEDGGWIHLTYGTPHTYIAPTQAQVDALYDILAAMRRIRHAAERDLAAGLAAMLVDYVGE